MPTVTEHFAIAGPVPFVDVQVDKDNRLFLDPHAIRLATAPMPYVADAIRCADTFLDEVTDCAISRDSNRHVRGQELLSNFVEPWESRLGMSADGFSGHGGAEVVGSWIWRALREDVEALVRIGMLRQLEDLPLFVEGVDRDITSDVTTRIMFGPLGRFTEEMVREYPELQPSCRPCRRRVWFPDLREWGDDHFELPFVEGKPLLLVPEGWARPRLLMSATRFYETSVLSFAQLQQAVITADGKMLTTPKETLMRQNGLSRGRGTNLRITLAALETQSDLIAAFKAFVAARIELGERAA